MGLINKEWMDEYHEGLVQNLNGKADKANTYTKAQVDAAIDDIDVTEQLADYAKKTEVSTAIAAETERAQGVEATKANSADVTTSLAGKQDTISDLATIRSGAALGATAKQPATTIAGYGITDAYTKQEVNNLVSTPHQQYVTVATKADLDAITTGSADTIYRVSNYDGTQVDTTKYAEYAWDGTQFMLLTVKSAVGEVFDVSEYNSGTSYETLAAALAAVPASAKRGGMSIKFIQLTTPATYSVVRTDNVEDEPTGTEIQDDWAVVSGTYTATQLSGKTLPANVGDSITYYRFIERTVEVPEHYTTWVITNATNDSTGYVQYRYMGTSTANADFTNAANWQGVDDELTYASNNLVMSGFMFSHNQAFSQRNSKVEKGLFEKTIEPPTPFQGCYEIINGTLVYNESNSWNYIIIPVVGIGRVKTAAGRVYGTKHKVPAIIYLKGEEPTQTNFISGYEQYVIGRGTNGLFDSGLTIPAGATHIIVNDILDVYPNIELYADTFSVDKLPIKNSKNPIASDAVYKIAVALGGGGTIPTTNVTTNISKAIVMLGGVPVEKQISDVWAFGIISVDELTHLVTFAGAPSATNVIPAVIFLRNNEISPSSYIQDSQKFGTQDTSVRTIKKFDEDIVVPDEANYVAINCYLPLADDTTIITGEGYYYDLREIDQRIQKLESSTPSTKKLLTVKKQPSSGEYGTIADALRIADSNTIIYVYDGVYEENHLNLPKDITIIGIGDVEIKGYLSPDTAISTSTAYSTFECYNGATLENLKVTAQNMRYPIHADFSDGNAKWVIKNCIFEHKGNKEINDYWASRGSSTSGIATAQAAWGGGTRGGDSVYCFNCKFISTGRAFSTHNNAEQSYNNYGASHVVVDSCEMISKGIDRDGVLVDLLAPLFVQSLNCQVESCDVVISNCSINGYIVFQNSSGDGWSNKLKMFNCGKNKIAFSKYGGGPSLLRDGNQISTYESHYDKYPMISDCCHSFVNRGSSAITKGKAVKKTATGGIALYDDTNDDVFGISMQDIPVGEVGDVWFDGYLSRIWLDGIRTTNITEGSDIYVDNTGSFSTSGTKIAFKAVDNQNVQLFS